MLAKIASITCKMSSLNTDFMLKSSCSFSQASFIFQSTPSPVQFIKTCPTFSVSPQQSHRPLLCNFICCCSLLQVGV